MSEPKRTISAERNRYVSIGNREFHIMIKKLNYNHTIYACFLGYITQAVIVNFAPLLFVTFQGQYGISLDKITLLVTINFGIQLFIDFASSKFIHRIGYRTAAVTAQIFAAAGLVSLSILPEIWNDPYIGLLISTTLYAIGGGLDEVIISPVVELCPTKRKAAAMSLLHSFYCWGQLFTILFSTAFFVIFGIENWRYLALIWAILPVFNAVFFSLVPMPKVDGETGTEVKMGSLFRMKRFWILALIMVCGGAAELCISQWASAFAQTGLEVNKTVGDLAGPCLFAALMGLARVLYAKFSDKLNMQNAMIASGILCVASYLTAALSPFPALGLAGCALAGFSVGIFWPCALSLGAVSIRGGGITLFAMLALFGDIGCTAGPTLVGMISDNFGGKLNIGILFSLIFPLLLIVGILLYKRDLKKEENLGYESKQA